MCHNWNLNRQSTIGMLTTVTVDRSTRFGFQASARRLELIIGTPGPDETGSGSSLRLVIEDSPEILAAIASLLTAGQETVERIGESSQVVLWPAPDTKALRPKSPRWRPRPSEQLGIWETGT